MSRPVFTRRTSFMEVMREVHRRGYVLPQHDTDTQYGARAAFGGEYGVTTAPPGAAPSVAARRCDDGTFDAVRTPSMARAAGPFATLQEAEEAAAIARMEKRAERIEAAAIKALANRIAEAKEDDE